MKKLQLKQNTQEWEEFRRVHIGASDAPTICGVNPYKSIYNLWKEKATGESFGKTHHMERGLQLESTAREHAQEELEMQFDPVCGLHPNINYMMASFDGYNEKEKCILEIKCPGDNTFRQIEE